MHSEEHDPYLQVEALDEALTTAQAEAEALRSLVGDAYETLKRIEQCAGEALVVASAKDACDKIDAALSGSQT